MSTRWYPIYQRGNPQLRVFLPNFSMKLVKPDDKQPPDVVQFQVPTGMSNHDIKSYLTKVYKVPVAEVRSEILAGACKPWAPNRYIIKEDDYRRAYVKLERGHTFQYPNITELNPIDEERERLDKMGEEMERNKAGYAKRFVGERSNIPAWFTV